MKINFQLFEAFLKCPTKCWLRFTCEPPSGNEYAEWVRGQDEFYRREATWRLQEAVSEAGCVVAPPAAENLKAAKWRLAVDLEVRADGSADSHVRESRLDEETRGLGGPRSEQLLESRLHAVERIPFAGRGQPVQFVPIRFNYRNKLTKDDKLLLSFEAFVLSEMLGRAVSLGKIIHGDDHATFKVKTGARTAESARTLATSHELADKAVRAPTAQAQPRVTKVKTPALPGEVRKRLGKIAALLASPTLPDLVLNRHCAECEFQARCRKLAVEKDDLSLLAGMSAKERQKLRSKGIFTVTQLSYTFRPRRRPRRQRDKREKYHHALKALAIREKKIHIVGSPELKIEGTSVYLDVEGLPDRDFYYLIGVRIGHGDSAVQHSLWADTVADEEKIWREFLALLETVEQPVLIHYGSYEKTFLKEMKNRHGEPPAESTVAKSMQASVNLLLHNFAQIYFPAISNGLKDTAGSLGFKWGEAGASGLNAIAWRCQWEELRQTMFKERLIAYNTQDCEALGMVTDRILQLTSQRTTEESSQTESANVVQVDSKEFQWKSKWKAFKSPVTGFEYINAAAHWDYQRDHVYARSGKLLKKARLPHPRKRRSDRAQIVIVRPSPRRCPKCRVAVRIKIAQPTRTVHDIVFGRHSMKQRVVQYIFRRYRCWKCWNVYGTEERFLLFRKYGWNLVAYLFYQLVELNISQVTAARHFTRLFGFELSTSTLNNMKRKVAGYYAETKKKILDHIVRGSLVHADETRANIKGKTGFVWVLTNMDEVYYMLADSREGDIVQKLLPDFKGVLVSDFYTAYDSIGCPQQRCLIHLMRDLNDEILNNPFDDQLQKIVTAFGVLLRPMIETVDRYGLKKHFLKKHLVGVERFYRELEKTDLQSEAALKCKDRFERNRHKLFTFLNYDGVPWNNNNAEHAVKAFARVRDNVAGASTAKGLEEYLVLLSICQTCKNMGVDFLDFLRSGEKDIHAFAESRHRRRRRTQTSQPTGLPAEAIPDTGSQP
jgi:predicted RecB family nuclease